MRFWLALVLVLFCTAANAEDYTLSTETDIERNYLDLNTELNLDYNYLAPHVISIMDKVTFGEWIPGTRVIKYRGIHGAITDQIKKRLKRIARRQIRFRYDRGDITDNQTNQAFTQIGANTNPYGNWWDRKWFHSLPVNKGGAQTTIDTVYIGHKIQIPNNWGIISYFRNKFEKIGDIWVRNDQLYEGIEDIDGLLVPGQSKEDARIANYLDTIKRQGTAVIIDGKDIDQEWFQGNSYNFRFKPSLRIKGGPDFVNVVDEVSLKFVVELFSTRKRTHVADISFFARYNIPDDELFTSIVLEVLTW